MWRTVWRARRQRWGISSSVVPWLGATAWNATSWRAVAVAGRAEKAGLGLPCNETLLHRAAAFSFLFFPFISMDASAAALINRRNIQTCSEWRTHPLCSSCWWPFGSDVILVINIQSAGMQQMVGGAPPLWAISHLAYRNKWHVFASVWECLDPSACVRECMWVVHGGVRDPTESFNGTKMSLFRQSCLENVIMGEGEGAAACVYADLQGHLSMQIERGQINAASPLHVPWWCSRAVGGPDMWANDVHISASQVLGICDGPQLICIWHQQTCGLFSLLPELCSAGCRFIRFKAESSYLGQIFGLFLKDMPVKNTS